MKKGFFFLFVLLFVSVVWIARPKLEQWLYRCQSTTPRCNDPLFCCTDIYEMHRLPLPFSYGKNTEIFENPESKCRILYFHGRGRTRHYNFYMLGPLYHETKCSIVVFEYPACDFDPLGPNDGPEILFDRAKTLLLERVDLQTDFLMCSSMGCSILLKVLEIVSTPSAHFKGIILENPPTSLADVVSFHTWIPNFFIIPFLGVKNDWRISDDFPYTVDKVLLFTSEKDELVPPIMGSEIAQHFVAKGMNVTQVHLYGANHGDAPSHPLYQKAIKEFIHQ